MKIETVTSPSGGTTAAVVTVPGAGDLAAGLAELDRCDPSVAALLLRHGAVFLRGLPVGTPEDFRAVVDHFGVATRGYAHGNSPRTQVTDGVYTSTDYPAGYDISLHNELSYAPDWPERLYFCCLVEPAGGGATHLCDGRTLLRDLDAGVRERFERHGVTYRRSMHGGFGLGKSWQATYETDDREAVRKLLDEAGAGHEWTADGGLRSWQTQAATRAHPVTGERAWFNQADQWHVSNLPPADAEALLSLAGDPTNLPLWASYGDGSDIPAADLDEVRATAERHALDVPWRRGDVLLVENMLALHGRRAYTGDRRILVAMS
ncbi:TauD/TfdA family dioxygenase [Micromonospora sediminicola]|uniref:TauD/TfdA family dioxygenase n=1 Tax=Micromonospora sediminicola TaxID=946078 RepID=UPI0033B190FC